MLQNKLNTGQCLSTDLQVRGARGNYFALRKGQIRYKNILKQLTSWALITKKYNENNGGVFFYWQSCVFHFRFKVMWKPQPMSIKRLLGKKSQWPEWWLSRLTVHVLAILQLTLVSLRYDWKEIFTINFFFTTDGYNLSNLESNSWSLLPYYG